MRAKVELPIALPNKAADTDSEDAEVADQRISSTTNTERREEKRGEEKRSMDGEVLLLRTDVPAQCVQLMSWSAIALRGAAFPHGVDRDPGSATSLAGAGRLDAELSLARARGEHSFITNYERLVYNLTRAADGFFQQSLYSLSQPLST